MIGKIDPRAYDCEGRAIRMTPQGNMRLWPTDEFISYLTGNLTVPCNSLEEVQAFLRKCRYTSDPDQFGVGDFWMHPRHFERARRGDCEDFALWTWRQLLAMGIDARFVCGKIGDRGHAWVTFSDSQTHYLFEPTIRRRRKLSRFGILLYKPDASISFHEGKLVYHEHEPRDYNPMASEPLAFTAYLLGLIGLSLLQLPWFLVKKAAWLIQKLVSRPETQENLRGEKAPGPPPMLLLLGDEVEVPRVRVAVNDLLPRSWDVIKRLRESGFAAVSTFGSSSRPPERPEKKLITFGIGVPPERIRAILHAAGDFVDFIQTTYDPLSIGSVYIGSYGYRATDGQPMAKLTPELKAVLLDPSLSATALRAAIARHADQEAGGE